MPAADTVLLPICVGLALLGLIATGIGWRRGNRGRVVQGVGLTLAPIALYFTGLLRVLWDFVVDLIGWAARIVFSPAVWFGISLLGLCVVLWVVGGVLARRTNAKKIAARETGKGSAGAGTAGGSAAPKAVGGRPAASGQGRTAPAKKSAAPVDDDFAEIEALLKKRGIE